MTSELNTFFPFDPYKLPRSGEYIQGVYREWASVAIDDDEEEEDEETEEDGEREEVDECAASQTVGIFIGGVRAEDEDTQGLGESFGGMSISPARPAQTHVLVV